MSFNSSYNEKDLLHRIADGDEAAFRILYERYALEMYRNALKFTKLPERARDLTQDVFLRLWAMREKLRTVEKFDAFLYVVARNLIFNDLKKQLPIEGENKYLEAFLAYDQHPAHAFTETKELQGLIMEAVEKLPPQLKTVFLLSRFEGLTHDQIAARMNISSVTSKSYIVRALAAIRKYLEEKGVDLGIILIIIQLFNL